MKNKKVKIVATLGPATQSPKMIEELAEAGVDVYRINLSHQKKDNILEIVKSIRETEKKLKKPLSIMGDLCGLKVRIGKIEENTILKSGDTVKISTESVNGSKRIFSINYPVVIKQLKKDTKILIDDGLIRLIVVEEAVNGIALTMVETGGPLLSHKGFYAKDISLSMIGVTEKDAEDIKLMAKVKVDALAVSFVQTQQDILQVKEKLPPDSGIILIAKIETKLGIDNIESIIDASDGVMVARGDLGLAIPIAQVPLMQKKLISICLKS